MAYAQTITNRSTVEVTAAYGYYPAGGAHGGIDTKHINYEVYSPASGTIIVAHAWQGGTNSATADSWGNYYLVDMGNNEYWLAAHFDDLIHSVGEILTKGDYLGKQGRTGNVTGVHTHWERWSGGQSTVFRVNPAPFIGLPNAVATYEVSWGGEEPSPDPPSPTVGTVIFNPQAGTYRSGLRVRLTSSDGGTVLYTTSNTAPIEDWIDYTRPITLTKTTRIRAVTVKDGVTSPEYTSLYVIKKVPVWMMMRRN